MKEKSQIEEMRAAVRGDLERSRARREATAAEPARAPEPVSEQEPEPPVEPEPRPPEEAPRPGLLSSLFRRR